MPRELMSRAQTGELLKWLAAGWENGWVGVPRTEGPDHGWARGLSMCDVCFMTDGVGLGRGQGVIADSQSGTDGSGAD
jgi:hypothetical protein